MVSPNGTRAILFDLDGTLRYHEPSGEATFLELAVELGVPDSPERRREAMRWTHEYWAQSDNLLADQEQFNGEDEQFWINYIRRHLISFACPEEQAGELAEKLDLLMRERGKPEDLLRPGVPETLQTLKESGFKLAVVSNRTQPYRDQLAKLGLISYFDCVVAAGEINSWKPDPEIFVHSLGLLDVAAHEAIYVGDNYYADVIGSQRAGLRPVLIDPEGVFPGAECEVITEIPELLSLLDYS